MTTMWWVNQGQSFKNNPYALEIVWAPLLNSKGTPESNWERLQEVAPGDIIVHYAQRSIRGFSIANARASLQMSPYDHVTEWGEQGRRIDVDFAPLDIPIQLDDISLASRLNDASPSPFNKNGEVNQGYFYRVSEGLKNELELLLGVKFGTAPNSYGDPVTTINGETDREGIAKYRTEQPKLRLSKLQGRTTAQCELCSRLLPEQYLDTAHIKRRADASDEERRDVNIVMLACRLGCDTAFEQGDIRVSANGTMRVTSNLPHALADHLGRLDGQVAPAFNQSNRKYFLARNASFQE